YNGFDTGIFLCTPGLFSALERAGRDGGDASLSGGVRLLAREGRARVFPVTGHFWIDIDDPVAFEQAERALSADSRRSR
nr:hypothetical protein [Nitrospinaceae bacterium]NIR56957.1 hypothetical protein [Nitrospinaceae bacterium]NIS87413.1 hypothetical protein [Nitrospinaceae bacterium]NIT84265.1 hypothetical protein [Nitrospinaceae bacterium]NIU46453.1 hypothetical protein [Nitrospinaceae bacterium]